MTNKDLNVFEILGEKEPDSKKKTHEEPSGESNEWNEWSKYFENRIEERHSWNTNGQERNAPDRFFDEEIIRAMSQKRPEQPSPEKKTKNKQRDIRIGIPKQAGAVAAAGLGGLKGIFGKLTAESDSARSGWKSLLIELAIAAAVIVVITQFFISISYVSGDSMNPAFYNGDRVVIQRFAKGGIEKGDVIVFETEKDDKLIKRVIATEGDTVDISKNQGGLYVNGEAVEEDYIYTVTAITDEEVSYPITVGEDSYFVLGDNRTNSKDSRSGEIGLVQKKDVVGKVILSIRGSIGEQNEAATGKDSE